MSQATITPPDIKTLADLRRRLEGFPWSESGSTPRPALPRRRMSSRPRNERTVSASWSMALGGESRWDSRNREWPCAPRHSG